jgi:hypothetical protein
MERPDRGIDYIFYSFFSAKTLSLDRKVLI